ncbi:hypothetical protein AJ87_06435 [Rhizobium yanglingense]|nr:hypothetical protein AJ87_06435 [Rhizobium yanglingense]
MIDMSVTGGVAATEASPAARGNGPAAKDGDAGNGGFSDVLSKAGNSPQNSTAASLLCPLRLMMPKQTSMKAPPAVSLSVCAIALAASR